MCAKLVHTIGPQDPATLSPIQPKRATGSDSAGGFQAPALKTLREQPWLTGPNLQSRRVFEARFQPIPPGVQRPPSVTEGVPLPAQPAETIGEYVPAMRRG